MYASSRTWDRHAGGSLVSTHRHLPLLIFGGKRMLLLGILSQTNQEMVSQVQGTLSHQSARSRSETYTKKKTVFEPHPWKRGPIPGPGGRSGRTASFTWRVLPELRKWVVNWLLLFQHAPSLPSPGGQLQGLRLPSSGFPSGQSQLLTALLW